MITFFIYCYTTNYPQKWQLKKKKQPYYLTISDVKNLDATYLSPLAQGFS